MAESQRDMDRIENEMTSEQLRCVSLEDAERTARDENNRLTAVIRVRTTHSLLP